MRSSPTGEFIFRDPSEQDRTVYHSGECLYAVHGSAGLGELGSPGQAEAYPTWGMLQLACRATARVVAIIRSPAVNLWPPRAALAAQVTLSPCRRPARKPCFA